MLRTSISSFQVQMFKRNLTKSNGQINRQKRLLSCAASQFTINKQSYGRLVMTSSSLNVFTVINGVMMKMLSDMLGVGDAPGRYAWGQSGHQPITQQVQTNFINSACIDCAQLGRRHTRPWQGSPATQTQNPHTCGAHRGVLPLLPQMPFYLVYRQAWQGCWCSCSPS